MGADSSTENTPNALERICPICLTSEKGKKRLHWASVVRVSSEIGNLKNGKSSRL